jgi:hypothetical protein
MHKNHRLLTQINDIHYIRTVYVFKKKMAFNTEHLKYSCIARLSTNIVVTENTKWLPVNYKLNLQINIIP